MNDIIPRFGQVAIVGRPNVGKSTLVNRLVGQKVSITAPKPQTTRHRVTGIITEERGQVVLIDTPGLHQGGVTPSIGSLTAPPAVPWKGST